MPQDTYSNYFQTYSAATAFLVIAASAPAAAQESKTPLTDIIHAVCEKHPLGTPQRAACDVDGHLLRVKFGMVRASLITDLPAKTKETIGAEFVRDVNAFVETHTPAQ